MDSYKILKHVTIAIDILFVFLLLFNYLNYLPKFWNMTYIFFAIVVINTIFLAFKIKQIPEAVRDKSSMIYYFSHFFLLSLIIIVLNQFLKRQFIIDFMPEITIVSIALGFLTFYAHRNKVEREIEDEKIDEEKKEKKRYNVFGDKFPRLNKIPLLRRFARWMYKEGWWYIVGLILIVVLGFVLRIWNLNYLQGADNFNLLSAKALYQTGNFVYTRNLQITYPLAFLFKHFGATWAVARIPFVIIGTFSIFLIYFLGRFINKKIGLITSFLLAISPVAIEKSSFIREYAENFLWGLILAIILIYIFIKYKDKPKKFFLIYTSIFIFSSGLLYWYGTFVNNGTLNAVLLMLGFLTVPLFLFVIKHNFKRLLFPAMILTTAIFLAFFFFVHRLSEIFVQNNVWNMYWFRMFFDPMVQFPMQWFSFSAIGMLFLVGLFLLPLMMWWKKRDILIIMNFVFWGIVILFMIKYYGVWGYYWSRYLYHLYPFYITIFATGLFYFIKSVKKSFNKFILVFIIIFLLIMVIIPQNTMHGARHDLSRYDSQGDDRQPTAAGNRNFFYNIFALIEKNGFSNKEAIIIEEENQFFLSWYFDYPITRNYTTNRGATYEVGDRVYIIYPEYGLNELDQALRDNNKGYLVGINYPEQDFKYANKIFKYLGKSERYKVFLWE